jgi:hypothetical protein
MDFAVLFVFFVAKQQPKQTSETSATKADELVVGGDSRGDKVERRGIPSINHTIVDALITQISQNS